MRSTDNRFGSDALTVLATGNFADKNVGTGKTVSVSGVSLGGADAGNYSIISTGSSPTANITRLAQVSWVGGATGNWFDPTNWAGGAVPDLANVANVTIPAGVTVNFGTTVVAPAQAGAVSLDTLGTAGSLNMSGGTLNVGSGGVTLNTLTQTGGSLNSAGSVALGSLSQTAGSLSAGSLSTSTAYSQTGTGTISVTGPAVISASNGPVVLGNLTTTGSLNVNSTGGAITQTTGTTLSVGAAALFRASANGQPADVLLPSQGNSFAQPVQVVGAHTSVAGTNGSSDNEAGGANGAPPPVLSPALANAQAPYVVNVLRVPQVSEGVLHLALRDVLSDQQVVLPEVVRDWVAAAHGDWRLVGPSGEVLEDLSLSANGEVLLVKARAGVHLPEQVVLQSGQDQWVVRLVKAP